MLDWSAAVLVLAMTVAALAGAAFIAFDENRKHILEHWVEYRCSPLILPFAWVFGKDTLENFQFCTFSSFKSYAGFLFEPFGFIISIITGTLGDLSQGLDDLRTMTSQTRSGFLGIVGTVFGKLQNTLAEVIILFARMRDIISRIIGVFVTLGYTGEGVAQTGESLMNGPIGQVISYFCFHPDTPLRLANGSCVPISAVRLGDRLEKGSEVTSILEFKYEGTPMFKLGDIIVSGNHLVKFEKRWIPVSNHPSAVPTEYLEDKLICLNTDTNRIPIGGFQFRDFEETSDPSVVEQIQRKIAAKLGCQLEAVTGTWSTGIHPDTPVPIDDAGTTVPASAIRPGQEILGGVHVCGIVRHAVERPSEDWFVVDGVCMLADTLFRNCSDGSAYKRACFVASPAKSVAADVAVHLCTQKGYFFVNTADSSGLLKIRDENECVERSVNDYRDRLIRGDQEAKRI